MFEGSFTITAKTLQGLEDALAAELDALGATDIEVGKRAVTFTADLPLLYKVNLWSRLALRFLLEIGQFKANTPDELYNQMILQPFEDYFDTNSTFAIDTVVFATPGINHSKYAALKAKDALVDRYRKLFGTRPNVDTENPNIQLHLHISGGKATLSLDSSGQSLHIRGYKVGNHPAPLNEVLAAGLITLSGWDKQTPFYDPMCGSGTLLTEAALMATNTPPNLLRQSFGFMHWPGYNEKVWNTIYAEALKERKPLTVDIGGSDLSAPSLSAAAETLDNLNFTGRIKLRRLPFNRLEKPETPQHVIINPPYGERLVVGDIQSLYTSIGNKLKADFAGSTVWLISSNTEGLKYIGLRPSQRIPVFNGPLECKFCKFELFDGEWRDRPRNEDNTTNEPKKEYKRKEYTRNPASESPYPKRRTEGEGDFDRPYKKREDGDKPSFDRPYKKREDGDKPSFDRPYKKREDGDKPSFDRPYKKREDGDKPSFDRPYKKREDGDKPSFDRPYKKREDGDKPSFDRPYKKREDGDKPSFDRPYKKREDGEKRPYVKREDGERKPFKKRDDGEKKPLYRQPSKPLPPPNPDEKQYTIRPRKKKDD